MRADEFTRKAKRTSTIYLDMDGVLADFFAEYAKLANVKTYRDIPPAKVDPILNSIAGTDFFGTLPKFPTTDALVKLAVSYAGSYSICSSPLRDDFENSEYWKRIWIKAKLNTQPQTTEITSNKAQFATNNGVPNILIDDKGSNIKAWIEAGGIGIKYQADEDSLDKVKRALDSIYCEVKDTCDWDDEELPPAMEAWSEKYKKSINCSNPKGFSQRAHCDGRKKKVKEMSHREAEKLLKKHHYHLERTHGGHEVWKDEEGHTFALPHKHHGKDIAKGVEHALKKEITHENFADGKKPGRKGLAKRMGVDCSKSETELRAIAKRSTGEKQRMAHWCANMKGGKR